MNRMRIEERLIGEYIGRGFVLDSNQINHPADYRLYVYQEFHESSKEPRWVPGTRSTRGQVSLERLLLPGGYELLLEDGKRLKIIIQNMGGEFQGTSPFF